MTDVLTPTKERQRHAGNRYLPPHKSREIYRPAGKVLSSLELMFRRGYVTPVQFEAGTRFMNYFAGASRGQSITASYGDQRWSGTTDAQADLEALTRPEWHTYCHQQVKKAYDFIGNNRDLIALVVLMEDGTAESIGYRLGYNARSVKIEKGRAQINSVLDKLAVFYGLLRPPS